MADTGDRGDTSETGDASESPSEADQTAGDGLGRRDQTLQALGAVLMVAGLVVAVVAYVVASNQNSGDLAIDNLEHNEHTILAIAGLTGSVVGGVVFLRYSLSRALQVWSAPRSPLGRSHPS